MADWGVVTAVMLHRPRQPRHSGSGALWLALAPVVGVLLPLAGLGVVPMSDAVAQSPQKEVAQLFGSPIGHATTVPVMYFTAVTTSEDRDGDLVQDLHVGYVSSVGERESVITLVSVNAPGDAASEIVLSEVDRDAPWSRLVAADRSLVVRFEQRLGSQPLREFVRLYDLDRGAAIAELPGSSDRYTEPEGVAVGPTGRVSAVVSRPDGSEWIPDSLLVLDPDLRAWQWLAWREPSIDGTGPWLADGSGWAPSQIGRAHV